MPQYDKYTTTVVGAHSVPRWYEALDRLVTLGQLAAGDFADAQTASNSGCDPRAGNRRYRRHHRWRNASPYS